MLWLITDKV